MDRYNLLDEPWIRVINNDGEVELKGLNQIFNEAHTIQRIYGDSRTQDFKVFRLLVAITQTVYSRVNSDGKEYHSTTPDDDEYIGDMYVTWVNVWEDGQFSDHINDYLEQWRHKFYLYSDDQPFMQVRPDFEGYELRQKEPGVLRGRTMDRNVNDSANKAEYSSYKDETHKDILTDDEVARWLLTYHGYTSTSDKTQFRDFSDYREPFSTKDKPPYSKGWEYDIGGLYVLGDNLFETIWLNTVLVHPNERYRGLKQQPTWEMSSKDYIEWHKFWTQPDNLAQLYTTWARAVTIDSNHTEDDPFVANIVKLPNISREDHSLEVMTAYAYKRTKTGVTTHLYKQGDDLWRNYGLWVNPDLGIRPFIIDWLSDIGDVLAEDTLTIVMVGMISDGNSTSWIPTDEVYGEIKLPREVAINPEYRQRVYDMVGLTKTVVDKIYYNFIKGMLTLQGVKPSDSNIKKSKSFNNLNYGLNAPFQRWVDDMSTIPFQPWVGNMSNVNDLEEHTRVWKDGLYQYVKNVLDDELSKASPRDLEGIKDSKGKRINAPILYQQTLNDLRRELKNT